MADKRLTKKRIDLTALKAGGFIKQRQPEYFAVRLRVPFGDLTSDQLETIAKISKKYGSGNLHLTARQGIEINNIKIDDFDSVKEVLLAAKLFLGACGARVRVVTGCPGKDVCPKGVGSTKSLGKVLDDTFFGQGGLPHKFKMAVTGCPNSCVKPQENDLGFIAVVKPLFDESENECISCGICEKVCVKGALKMVGGKPVIDVEMCDNDGLCIKSCPVSCLIAEKEGWNITVGGRFGRKPKLGQNFKNFVSEKEAKKVASAVIEVYKNIGERKERLGVAIDRIGIEVFKREVEAVLGKEKS